jgi:signal transduction histidine kinase
MPDFSPTSLRSRSILLVLLALLPVLVLTLYSYFDGRNRAIREVQRDELVAARNLAAVQETLIASTGQLLAALARLPQVQRRDRNACDSLFAGLMAQCPHYAVLVSADLEGQVFASAPASPGPVNIADRLFFQKAVETQGFVVGEPLLGRISKKHSINLAYPIVDDAGRVQGVLTAGIDLNWLGGLLAKSDLPPSTGLALADAAGRVLFRYPDPLKYFDTTFVEPVIKAMNSRMEGVLEGKGLPGDLRLLAFTRLAAPLHDLRLVIGIPKEVAIAKVNHELWRNLLWLAAVSLLALSAARLGGKTFILRPVNRLLEVTRRLTSGDLTARNGAPYQSGELGQLARAFDHMADSLQGRNAELKRVVVELKKRVRQLDVRTAQLEASNKELADFTYTVSHDLRAPLRSIGGFARVLMEEYPAKLDADGQRYLNIIYQDARRMGQLIDDLLALTRLGRKEMSLVRIDMAELARAVWEEVKAPYPERNLHIEIQPLPPVLGDRVMMRQVMAQLLENALKFTSPRATAEIEVSGKAEEDGQVYCVKDNGVGFEMRYVNKLFEVFQRLHTDEEFAGTGVGLAIVKRIIDRHGGRLWAEGKVGGGAAFYFALPRREEE